MTTLLTIPGAKALHLPTPGASPLPLATGDLNLVQIPANPPTHPSTTITLSVGSSSFPLLPNSPLQRVKAKEEHPSYLFTPIPVDGGAPVGQVLIRMADSTNQGQWDATEVLCKKLEETLKTNHLWDERVHFVNDEYDTAGVPVKGWGETVAGAVTGGASFLAAKISGLADSHVGSSAPKQPMLPSPENAARASGIRNATAHLAVQANTNAANLGAQVHAQGTELAGQLPPNVRNLANPTPEHEKGEFRKLADDGWEQATIAAKGLAGAAVTVGKSISESTHRAVEHNFGKEADRVVQDIGQTGSNLGSTIASAGTAASTAIHGKPAI